MSDKPALPPGWTGTAPDADAMFAMAEVALDTMPAVFLPHIQGVVIAIEEFADDEVLKSLDIEHPYDLTGLYEGRPLTERSIGESGGMPDRVTLYRIPILVEWIETGERLDRLVRHVLIHEIGHHFGFSRRRHARAGRYGVSELLRLDGVACIRGDRLLFENLSLALAPGDGIVAARAEWCGQVEPDPAGRGAAARRGGDGRAPRALRADRRSIGA